MSEQRFSILVVDDNAVNRLALARWLEKTADYEVATAADGLEALRRVRTEPVDLVLLDNSMPVMSGLDVLKALRQAYSPEELPVIMATSQDQSEEIVEAFNLGANDYLTKPFDYPVALARVQAQLRALGVARETPKQLMPMTSLREIEPGTVLEGRYRLDALIGSGQFGAVYRATHLTLKRPVAIKLLHTGIRDDCKALELFQREGISACRVEHPNAVAVFDFTATRYGIAFMVMELLRGSSLEEELRREGRFAPERCGEIAVPVLDVLAEAHSVGIIHRDVKPQNIFLHESRQGEMVKVLDFGLAKLVRDTAEELDASEDCIAGTLAYLAPERALAETCSGKADVYSVGVMLYQMLTGRLPFLAAPGSPLEVMMMHVRDSPPPPRDLVPEIPREIEDIVLQAMTKDPAKRPSADELCDLLAGALGIPEQSGVVSLGDQSGFALRALLEEELRKSGYGLDGQPLPDDEEEPSAGSG